MRRTTLCLIALLLCSAPSIWADPIELWEWAFNFNGAAYASDDASLPSTLPGYVNTAGFDFATGLGTIAITFNPGVAGAYYVLSYLDHDLNTLANGFDDESAATHNALAAGQSFEIDDPFNGDIYSHVVGGAFDSFFDVWADKDVSMGLGWNFVLASGETALIRYNVSTTPPASGFYLSQHDDGVPAENVEPVDIYFNSTLDIRGGGGPEIPEPGTWLLMVAGLLGVAGAARRRRTN